MHLPRGMNDSQVEAARADDTIVKCIRIRDFKSKAVFAHVVQQKDNDEESWVANLVADDLAWFGYSQMSIKTDNEAALNAPVVKAIEKAMARSNDKVDVETHVIATEDPVPYESQRNGAIEVGARIVRGLFRTLKLCLEDRIGAYIPPSHPVVAWLLEYIAFILNIKPKGHGGLTPWRRARGKDFHQKILGFCEVVLHKLPSKGPHSDPDGDMGTRWHPGGLFLGYCRMRNVYIIGTESGITLTRSIMVRPVKNKWSREKIATLKDTPGTERRQPEAVALRPKPEQEARAKDEPTFAKQFRVTKNNRQEFGYTEGCPNCEHIIMYGGISCGSRTTKCRDRIIEALAGTEYGRRRLESTLR